MAACYLPRCVTRTVLLDELLDHTFEIRVAGSKAPCEPVPTALGNPLAVSDHLELTGLTRRNDGFNVEALFDEGHETRDLGLVVLSRRAVNDLDLHLFSKSASRSRLSWFVELWGCKLRQQSRNFTRWLMKTGIYAQNPCSGVNECNRAETS